MIRFLFLFLFSLVLSACSPKEIHIDENGEQEKFEKIVLFDVKSVISGDTIELVDGRIIKYINIEAPKVGNPFFETSKQANEHLIKRGKNKVFLEFGNKRNDAAGNYLAYVYSPTPIFYYCFVNKELLEWGYAKANISPGTKYIESFLFSEKNAKEKKLNIWKQ